MEDIRTLLDDLLSLVVYVQPEPQVAVHNISNSSLNSDIFLSGISGASHPPPNTFDYWLLNKIEDNQPDYISPDILEELNKSSLTPPTSETGEWSEVDLENTNNVEEIQTNDHAYNSFSNDLVLNNSLNQSGLPRRQIIGFQSSGNSDETSSIDRQKKNDTGFSEIYERWLDTKSDSVSCRVSEIHDVDTTTKGNRYCEKLDSGQSNIYAIESGLRTINQAQEVFELANSYNNKSSFPSAKKIKLDLSIDDTIKNEYITKENIEFEETNTFLDSLEEDAENERFQSLTSPHNSLPDENENEEREYFLSDSHFVPMTFDSSADLIWKLKKAHVLPATEPLENKRPGKKPATEPLENKRPEKKKGTEPLENKRPGKKPVESKRMAIKRAHQADNGLYRQNNLNNPENAAIVPEGSENIDNEDIETSMFIPKAANEKESWRISNNLSTPTVVDVPQNKVKNPENVAIIPDDLENIDNEDTEISIFINAEMTQAETVLGTPPLPQQGLCLLHKAPRIGLSKLQNVLTLHPKIKK